MTTHASATCFVKPPSRPTMPKIFAFTSLRQLEDSHQVHAHVLLAVAAADAEDEDARRPRAGASPCSHSQKQVSHPSSFTRAVSSLTLSVGAYASNPQILRKSLTAWPACPAAAADAEDEEAPAPVARPRRGRRRRLSMRVGVELLEEESALVEECLGEGGHGAPVNGVAWPRDVFTDRWKVGHDARAVEVEAKAQRAQAARDQRLVNAPALGAGARRT